MTIQELIDALEIYEVHLTDDGEEVANITEEIEQVLNIVKICRVIHNISTSHFPVGNFPHQPLVEYRNKLYNAICAADKAGLFGEVKP